MLWFILIFLVVAIVLGYAFENGKAGSGNANRSGGDLTEEEIEYDYLMREEQAQQEEDEYWLEQRNEEEEER